MSRPRQPEPTPRPQALRLRVIRSALRRVAALVGSEGAGYRSGLNAIRSRTGLPRKLPDTRPSTHRAARAITTPCGYSSADASESNSVAAARIRWCRWRTEPCAEPAGRDAGRGPNDRLDKGEVAMTATTASISSALAPAPETQQLQMLLCRSRCSAEHHANAAAHLERSAQTDPRLRQRAELGAASSRPGPTTPRRSSDNPPGLRGPRGRPDPMAPGSLSARRSARA